MVPASYWYNRVISQPNSVEVVVEAALWFEKEIMAATTDLNFKGLTIEEANLRIPGHIARRKQQWTEIEGIVSEIDLRIEKVEMDKFKAYSEHYQKKLTDTTAHKYAKVDPDVIGWRTVFNQMRYVGNLFAAHIEALEALSFKIGDVCKLRLAGIEQSTL